jgi:hypothetical protein
MDMVFLIQSNFSPLCTRNTLDFLVVVLLKKSLKRLFGGRIVGLDRKRITQKGGGTKFGQKFANQLNPLRQDS